MMEHRMIERGVAAAGVPIPQVAIDMAGLFIERAAIGEGVTMEDLRAAGISAKEAYDHGTLAAQLAATGLVRVAEPEQSAPDPFRVEIATLQDEMTDRIGKLAEAAGPLDRVITLELRGERSGDLSAAAIDRIGDLWLALAAEERAMRDLSDRMARTIGEARARADRRAAEATPRRRRYTLRPPEAGATSPAAGDHRL